jgi:MauM/NapG family ferredoxin protein
MMIGGIERAEASADEMGRKFSDVARHFKDDEPRVAEMFADPVRYLRPPGALPEPLFMAACTQCGDCITACPAQCIKVSESPGGPGFGYPYIEARDKACVVCTDLTCMKVCPTEALNLVEDVKQIDMGTAFVNDMTCLRGPRGDLEQCTMCIDHCPLGEEAIGLDPHHHIVQVREACIGCGVCEHVCPTQPQSIWVEPSNF